jgi:hypothetical protein
VIETGKPGDQWSPIAGPPQRYSSNYSKYRERGGLVNPAEDASGFAAGGQGDAARFFFFCLMQDQLAKEALAGDIAELGVYKGHTASLLATTARRLGKTAYLFDTFEGFNQSDFQGVDAGKGAQFTDTSLAAVRALVGEDNVQYVPGFFPKSTDQIPGNLSFSLVHIDCDLYLPAISALEYFYPRMVPGGFMVIHDYSSLGWSGAELAVDEFFADKPESVIPLPDSAGSAVIRKAKEPGIVNNWRIRKTRSIFNGDWTPTTNKGLTEILGAGWSMPESWGVWGVGATHELALHPLSDGARVLLLDFDVHAPLNDDNLLQEVVVLADGVEVARWSFSEDQNRSVRTIRVEFAERQRMSSTDAPDPLKIVFQPGRLVTPSKHDAKSSDNRELGMALHRLRVRRQ